MTDIKSLEGQKCTIVLINSIGFPVVRQIKVQLADIVSAKKYAGHMTYKTCIQLQYVEKGKRKPVAMRYTENELAIGLGWDEIKTPDSFMSFDKKLFEDLADKLSNEVYRQTSL